MCWCSIFLLKITLIITSWTVNEWMNEWMNECGIHYIEHPTCAISHFYCCIITENDICSWNGKYGSGNWNVAHVYNIFNIYKFCLINYLICIVECFWLKFEYTDMFSSMPVRYICWSYLFKHMNMVAYGSHFFYKEEINKWPSNTTTFYKISI
jgi:hypothetical protein